MRPPIEVGAGSRSAVPEAMQRLGVRRLALAIHDASLPGDPEDDLGRGTPWSRATLRLLAFARELGFDSIQLGPQGLTDEDDASPYMGTAFSRNPLSIALGPLADPHGRWGDLLPAARLAGLVARRPAGAERRVPYDRVFRAQREALGAVFESFERRRAAGDPAAAALHGDLERFERKAGDWLDSDALYDVLRAEYRGRDWYHWEGSHADRDRALGTRWRDDPPLAERRAELTRRYGPALRFYRFVQLLAHGQHRAFRQDVRSLGLRIFGDLQVGLSPRDTWRRTDMLLRGYRMGAPPSRTNPDGQPWDYPVIDPDACRPGGASGHDGPGLGFVTERVTKLFDEFDAVRIDHPQGLVCPWVYRADEPDPLRAVQEGARLFSSPDLEDHRELARYAIVAPEQLGRGSARRRWDDRWVERLTPDQVDRYAVVFDSVVEVARARGEVARSLICEVLSTLPVPLERVLARHGLGRFRVTQKADISDPSDVYAPENASPNDWIMFGNHDTPSLWSLIDHWKASGQQAERAAHAAARLAPSDRERSSLANRFAAEPGLLAHAEMAMVLASPAENVSIFFADVFGLTELYNRPGTVGPENWSLRLAPEWRSSYDRRLREDRALNLPLALLLGLRARSREVPEDLLRALRDEAERPRGGAPLG